jgi:hypothetical protein
MTGFGIHFLRIILGYLAAVFAAATTVSAILALTSKTLPETIGKGTFPAIVDVLETFIGTSIFAVMFVTVFAFPVWLMTIAMVEWRVIRAPLPYLLTGILAAVPLLIVISSDEPNMPTLWLIGLLAGLVGGYIYWRIAGRYAGIWKKPINSGGKL